MHEYKIIKLGSELCNKFTLRTKNKLKRLKQSLGERPL